MSLVLVVTVVVFIVSEKVTERDDEIETEVSEFDGEVEETVSDVVSVVLVVDSSFSPQEKMVRLKRNMEKMRSICLTWFPFVGLGKPKLYQNMWCFTRIGKTVEGI